MAPAKYRGACFVAELTFTNQSNTMVYRTASACAPHKRVEQYLQNQKDALGPNSPALMRYLKKLSIARTEDPVNMIRHFPKSVQDIIMDQAETMGKDPIFFSMSMLCMGSSMFKDVMVMMNGTEVNPLTLFM